jgi:transposase
MNITTIGVDLAKNIFQVHGVDACGKAQLRKQLKRAQMMGFFANLSPCLIGMEACGSAHFWARQLMELGHTVKVLLLNVQRRAISCAACWRSLVSRFLSASKH